MFHEGEMAKGEEELLKCQGIVTSREAAIETWDRKVATTACK